jgi:hypothetical protein
VRGKVDSGRRIKADDRKNNGYVTKGDERQSSAKGFASRRVDASASANMVEQTCCIPGKPACTRAFSDQSMVPGSESPFAKTYKTVDGLWGCEGIYTAP